MASESAERRLNPIHDQAEVFHRTEDVGQRSRRVWCWLSMLNLAGAKVPLICLWDAECSVLCRWVAGAEPRTLLFSLVP